MQYVISIQEDPREIEAIWYPGPDNVGYRTSASPISQFACEKIVAYGENGHMAAVPFYAVYRDGQIYARVPAQLVEVVYSTMRGGRA